MATARPSRRGASGGGTGHRAAVLLSLMLSGALLVALLTKRVSARVLWHGGWSWSMRAFG